MRSRAGRKRRQSLAKKVAEPGYASIRMSRQRRYDTRPEVELRSELHRRGLRFSTHVRPLQDFRREADIVFKRPRIAVFVDGCFWHGCPEHRTYPKRNASFWSEKIEMNRVRDVETDQILREAGWLSVRVWEHESVLEAADRVEEEVRLRTPATTP
jgi:DNA mismatch endonuclease, patch repair protein